MLQRLCKTRRIISAKDIGNVRETTARLPQQCRATKSVSGLQALLPDLLCLAELAASSQQTRQPVQEIREVILIMYTPASLYTPQQHTLTIFIVVEAASKIRQTLH